MKTTHRTAAKAKRHVRTTAELLARNPVAQTVRQHTINAVYQDKAMSCRIKMFLMADGEDATELLATLAVVIGATCQLATALNQYDTPQVRRMHGALRTLQALALGGYTWQTEQAPVLCNALDDADAISQQLRGTQEQVTRACLDAEWFADQIAAHQVTAQSVAGRVQEVRV